MDAKSILQKATKQLTDTEELYIFWHKELVQDVWKLPRKEELCKEGGCCTMQNAQCTMNNYTAKHGTPAHGIFWVQFVQQIGHHTMCSFLSLLGLLLVQCTASIVCSIPWRFLVFCNRSVQLIFISPCVLRLTFTACSISWLHLIFLLRSGPAGTSVCNIHRVVYSPTVFNVVLCALVNFHGSFCLQ